MKVITHGVVILSATGPIRVEGWNVEREPDDPADATTEQLLLGVAVHWAREKMNTAVEANLRKWLQDKVNAAKKLQSN
jgi:hypothetical protein